MGSRARTSTARVCCSVVVFAIVTLAFVRGAEGSIGSRDGDKALGSSAAISGVVVGVVEAGEGVELSVGGWR